MAFSQNIASRSLEEELRETLTPKERLRLGVRLFSALAGGGLLVVGVIYGRLFPDQQPVAALVTALAATVVAIPIFISAIRGFLSNPPEDFTDQLVSLAVLAAMTKGDFVTATLVPLFMSIGHFLEERSVLGAQAAIEKIRELHARHATLIEDGQERRINPSELKIGDTIIVRPGEVIPADGTVSDGRSSVDQAPVTGESDYEEVSTGSPVFAGTVNLNGLLTVTVTGVGGSTALGRVLELLQKAESTKAPVTKLLERYAAYYLPIVIAIAAGVLFITNDTYRAITVLVVACPCAFVLSSPTAMVATLAVASRLNVLIKNAGFLETVAEVDTLLLDKTGTVTLGRLVVTGLHPAEKVSEEELLSLAATCGYGSLHPVARAVVEEARERGVDFIPASRVSEEAGTGLTADSGAETLRLGRRAWLEESGVTCNIQTEGEDGTGVWLARDDEIVGSISMADRPRPEARVTLENLRNIGVERLVLLTGDKQKVAGEVAGELGFDDYVAEVLPEQKLRLVEQEKAAGRKVMVVGDGVNDALALAGADVGVAVGTMMNEVALGSADIAVMANNLDRLPRMIWLARETRRTINVNILAGAGFSVFMLALASFGMINPLMGAILHNGGALFVVLNSARLLAFSGNARAVQPCK